MKQVILISIFLLFVLSVKSFAQDGVLDKTFKGGIITTAISTDDEFGRAVAIQQDGKIVVAGNVSFNNAYSDFALIRYNSDGSLDRRFGRDGKVITPIGESDDVANAMALQTDGKIVVGGYSYVGSHLDFSLARYNSDGSLDKSFNSDGKLITSIGRFDDIINSVIIQPDGKIVVAGHSFNGAKNDFALARYNSNGSLDNTFNSNGIITFSIGKSNAVASALTLQPDGKIVVAGYADDGSKNDFALVRFNTNGTVDLSFGSLGIVTTAINNGNCLARSVTIQNDGKIVAAGESENDHIYNFALARYNADGSLDKSFNNSGIASISVGSGSSYARALTLQTDGKIIIAGYAAPEGKAYHFALARFNEDGSLDETLTPNAALITPIGRFDDEVNAIALQPDGKLIAAGFSSNGANYDFALTRYFSGSDEEKNQLPSSDQIKLFPNPVIDNLDVQVQGLDQHSELFIVNTLGKPVRSLNISGNETTSLNVADLPAGAYQIIITDKDVVKVGSFVKQ